MALSILLLSSVQDSGVSGAVGALALPPPPLEQKKHK